MYLKGGGGGRNREKETVIYTGRERGKEGKTKVKRGESQRDFPSTCSFSKCLG